jgi:hypothetical protein
VKRILVVLSGSRERIINIYIEFNENFIFDLGISSLMSSFHQTNYVCKFRDGWIYRFEHLKESW